MFCITQEAVYDSVPVELSEYRKHSQNFGSFLESVIKVSNNVSTSTLKNGIEKSKMHQISCSQ